MAQSSTAALTPMMEQYKAIKREHPDSFLFFRLGDFYEMFFEDAEQVSRELGLTLTAREAGKGKKVPMCGVPYHAANRYVARLVRKGYKVTICEQMEAPKPGKKIVRREVIRTITPGTVLENSLLHEKTANYITVFHLNEKELGLCVCDVTTGEFKATRTDRADENKLWDELKRLSPAECLISEKILTEALKEKLSSHVSPALTLTPLEDSFFDDDSYRYLCGHFQTRTLDGFGVRVDSVISSCAAALLRYIEKTQKSKSQQIVSISTYALSDFLFMDSSTRRNLELLQTLRDGTGGGEGTLLSVLDRTKTAMGSRLLRSWISQPLLQVERIRGRLSAVEEFFKSSPLRETLRELLKDIYDLERLLSRLVYGTANPRDLIALKNSLGKIPEIRETLKDARSPMLQGLEGALDDLRDVFTLIERAILDDPSPSTKEGSIVKPGYSGEADELRLAKTEGKKWMAKLEAKEKEQTGIKSLKVGFTGVFGYYIEVTKPNLHLVPQNYVRKQTTANGERFLTQELKEMEDKILGAEEKLNALEHDIFQRVRGEVCKQSHRLQQTARALATLDVLSALSEAASAEGYCKPAVTDGNEIVIRAGRHPVVEKVQTDERFVPNDVLMDTDQNQLLLITGPNMAGKSTYLRQTALIVLMAQMGSFVPAESARIGAVDRLFTRVGAHDDLAFGKSTFMVEMVEVANILHNATEKSLAVLDEIGRGTSTYDGLSIAWAVIEFLCEEKGKKPRTLFASHYHELTKLEGRLQGLKNHTVAVKEEGEKIIFLRKIIPGAADRSYGIHVARLAGLPEEVLNRARILLSELEVSRSQTQPSQVSPFPKWGQRGGAEENQEGITPKLSPDQLSFFQEELSRKDLETLLREISSLNLDAITPLEALNFLAQLKKRVG